MIFTPKFFYDTATGENAGGEDFKPKTKEQADLLNSLRKEAGEGEIPFIEQDASPVAKVIDGLVELSPEEKAAKEIEDKKIKDAEIAATAKIVTEDDSVIKIGAKVVKAEENDTTTEDADIEDAIILKQLSKKLGREITSLDDLKSPAKIETPEDKAAKEQERENAKLSFGLQNKKITNKEVEAFIADSGNPKSVAYDYFSAQQKEIDSSLTEKEIKEKFQYKYSLNEDEDSVEYKQGQKDLNFIANTLIKERHKKYLNLENEYSNYEQTIAEKEAYNKDILSKTPAYKSIVEKAAQKFKKIEIKANNSVYTIELDDSIISGYVNQMLTPDYAEKIISNGWSEVQIESSFLTSLKADNFDSLLESVLERELLKAQKGLKGVLPDQHKRPLIDLPVGSKKEAALKAYENMMDISNN